ncbi:MULTISPECIES: hypothetical protein [unclassified Fusobacterium]|uniref:hypothetical protein n=1 Tax=unclassified Fusobacterium TaxID=2648384 RepID=UPI001B8CAF66|nr:MULTISPECIES: hypothetical protein [unclassified Fusobacterium]MBR8700493.1 hypothetical protein [Fusobacterium sp. DD45]MBR8710242.1 hypothetical protein [Fusobacterium sp. DD28]MBR8750764.1 hypothetical protein [Fusobacterium sp. DD26]
MKDEMTLDERIKKIREEAFNKISKLKENEKLEQHKKRKRVLANLTKFNQAGLENSGIDLFSEENIALIIGFLLSVKDEEKAALINTGQQLIDNVLEKERLEKEERKRKRKERKMETENNI